jgi:hypothetical protein
MTRPPRVRDRPPDLRQTLVRRGQHGRDPLPVRVERGAPRLPRHVLGERLPQPGADLVARLRAPAHLPRVRQEDHGTHDVVTQRVAVAVGVVGSRPADAVRSPLVGHEGDRRGIRSERRARQCQTSGGRLERLTHRVAPGQRVTSVVHLVEDDQGALRLGARGVQRRLRRDLRVRQGHAVVPGAVAPLAVAEVRVDAHTHARGGVGPLVLEVLGRRDDRHPADDPLLEQLGRDPQRERRLARTGCGDGEEVPRRACTVQLERLGLPGTQLGGGTPGGAAWERGRQVRRGSGRRRLRRRGRKVRAQGRSSGRVRRMLPAHLPESPSPSWGARSPS